MEDKEHGLEFLLNVLLSIVEDFWLEFNVSGGVDSVDVTEGSGATRECGVRDLGKLFVGVPHSLRLCVETGGVDIGVVDTVFLTSGDPEFELEEAVDLGHALEVLLADGNVFFERFLGQVEHMGGEEGFTVLFVVFFVGNEESLEPLQPRLLAVICVKNDWYTVQGGNLADVLGSGNGSRDGGHIVIVINCLTSNKLSTSTHSPRRRGR